MQPNELGAAEAARHIRAGELSARELASACLDQIQRWDGAVHAWTYVERERAVALADAADAAMAGKVPPPVPQPLAGVPIGIKDIFNTIDMPTQMGSPIWHGFTPGNDARVLHDLKMAGGFALGKTVTAEFAVHAPGPTENPHRRGHIPGTSSSGSAAAVAAYMVPAALGTQTAGSIIRPASYCGIYGFKPSFGLVPRTGMLKTTDTLDTVGWFARSAEDVALIFETVRVKGADYPIGEAALSDVSRQTRAAGQPWRIGLVRGPNWNDAEPVVRDTVERFAATLSALPHVEVAEVDPPAGIDQAHDIHATIYDRALAYYFKEEFQRHTLVSAQIYEIIARGNALTLEHYQQALQQQRKLARAADDWFGQGHDAFIDMAAASSALPGLDSVDRPDHALIWTLCGLPAVSVPVGASPNRLPIGVQLVARRYDDRLLLNLLEFLSERELVGQRTFPEPPMAASAAST